MNPIYRRRLWAHRVGIALSFGAMAFGLIVLAWILFTLFLKGFGALSFALFTETTPAPGSDGGGLMNAIVGSLMLVGAATLISTPIGILAGIYLAEYGERSWFAQVTRFITDIMLSAPSIVIGLFIYEVMVRSMGHFSGLAGGIALAMILLPIVVRTTEESLRLVPDQMREAGFALGMPRWRVTSRIIYRAAQSAIVTGVLLAVARIAGETAPLLFTALNNQFWSASLNEPLANVPVVIFQYAMSPYDEWHTLAWAGAFVLTAFVLVLNVGVRILARRGGNK